MSTDKRSEPASEVFAIGTLVAVNLVVTGAILYFTTTGGEEPLRVPDLWYSFVPAFGVQVAVNGLLLLAFKNTRQVGAGVLAGVLMVAVLLCLWLLLVVPWP